MCLRRPSECEMDYYLLSSSFRAPASSQTRADIQLFQFVSHMITADSLHSHVPSCSQNTTLSIQTAKRQRSTTTPGQAPSYGRHCGSSAALRPHYIAIKGAAICLPHPAPRCVGGVTCGQQSRVLFLQDLKKATSGSTLRHHRSLRCAVLFKVARCK